MHGPDLKVEMQMPNRIMAIPVAIRTLRLEHLVGDESVRILVGMR